MKLVKIVGLALSLLSSSLTAANHSGESLGRPFLVSWDPKWLHSPRCSEVFTSWQSNASQLELLAYDYSTTRGIIIDDTGFLPSFNWAKRTPRRLRQRNGRLETDRDVSLAEIVQLNQLATEAVMEGYAETVQAEMRLVVNRVEAGLLKDQYSFGVVRDELTQRILGVLRVANGYVRNGHLILPALEILRARGLLAENDEAAINTHFGVVGATLKRSVQEIGQYFIARDLSPEDKVAVHRLLASWYSTVHLQLAPRDFVLAHVSTPVHERAYRITYGFNEKLIEKTDGGDDITEKLLIEPTESLKLHLDDLLRRR